MFLVVLAALSTTSDTARDASAAVSSAFEPVQVPTAKALADGSYSCTPAHTALLDGQCGRIADAPTVVDARKIAVGPVRVARRALVLATFVAPASDSL